MTTKQALKVAFTKATVRYIDEKTDGYFGIAKIHRFLTIGGMTPDEIIEAYCNFLKELEDEYERGQYEIN